MTTLLRGGRGVSSVGLAKLHDLAIADRAVQFGFGLGPLESPGSAGGERPVNSS